MPGSDRKGVYSEWVSTKVCGRWQQCLGRGKGRVSGSRWRWCGVAGSGLEWLEGV